MTVFRAFFQISRRVIGVVSVYLGIMVIMTMMITANIPTEPGALSVSTRDYRIAIHNLDGGDAVSQALEDNLAQRSLVQQVGTTEKDIKEALFWRDVDYIVQIPEGFGSTLLMGEPMKLRSYASPNDYTHMNIDNYANAFMGTLQAYVLADKGLNEPISGGNRRAVPPFPLL